MKYVALGIVGLSLMTLSSCNDEKTLGAARTEFFDRSGIDSSVRAADNFFQYANGKWIKAAVIPDDQSGWGSFYTLYEDNLKNLRSILEDASAANAAKNSLEQKLGDYYKTGMDTLAIEKAGIEPIKPMLARIDAIKDYKQLMELIAETNASDDGYIIGLDVSADEKNSKQNIVVLNQTGLSLPEKEYYTRQDSATRAARKALTDLAAKLFVLTGSDAATAEKNAAAILSLETEMAKSHRTPVETRDPQKNYNKVALADLTKEQPNINWPGIFTKMNAKVDSVDLAQPGYYAALDKLLASQPIEVWKMKMKFDYMANNASALTKSFRDAAFDFSKTFTGQKVQTERWKTIVNTVNYGLPDLLGQLYVKKYFSEEAKQRMDELVSNLQKAFEARIGKLDWMSDTTKQKATAKLNAFLKKIGYPSKWKNYDDVTIDKGNYFSNVMMARLHSRNEMIDKIGKPVDRTRWGMNVPDVNAYYNPTNNEIVFPAGILQFPFFDANADDAINYGAIGMVIGHEMTHGFDDQGSQYDEEGNMKNWWAASDAEKFKAKTGAVVKQYDAYTMFDSVHVNGQLTLGENLADIGGLAIAYDAFKMTSQGKTNEKIDGFTPDQRFFLGFAQVWRLKDREESMRMRLNADSHSPEIYRVNGPLSNFDPFYAAFGVKEGDKMYIRPADRARIW